MNVPVNELFNMSRFDNTTFESDDIIDDDVAPHTDTSFNDLVDTTIASASGMRTELVQTALDDCHNALTQKGKIMFPLNYFDRVMHYGLFSNWSPSH